MNDADQIRVPGLGQTQRELLHSLKRRGPSTTGELADGFDLATGTLREHIRSLESRRLVVRVGRRREGPGRPHVIYGLTDAGQALFPQGEAELLVGLVEHLLGTGHAALVEDFFLSRAKADYDQVAARLQRLGPAERLSEGVRFMAEAGYMPEVEQDSKTGDTVIRLCNCPLRSVVAVTQLPCRSEERLLSALVDAKLERIAYMPDGDDSCSYRIRST
ncbi:MAG: helix-turn-helix domain-containing protein [Gemmatimonadota bacterium]|nr:helix-turn-helix domain-containing protein [Gemmatimonadota bacterium]MDH3427780.1 helix-turn-helix domain-containing protein [Gemmatimonadota bacterium]